MIDAFKGHITHKPAILLDWDGTVRKSKEGEFIDGPDDLEWYEGVVDALWKYKNEGYLVLGVTNQGGIAYGYKTLSEFSEEIAEMERQALDELAWPFDGWTFCPFMKGGNEDRFDRTSLLRKPAYGMLAVLEYELIRQANVAPDWDADSTIMIGDREEDEELAWSVNIKFQWAKEWRKQIRKDSFEPPLANPPTQNE